MIRKGTRVEIIAGPFEGFTAKVINLCEDNNTVNVIAKMFGREVPLTVDSSYIERLDSSDD